MTIHRLGQGDGSAISDVASHARHAARKQARSSELDAFVRQADAAFSDLAAPGIPLPRPPGAPDAAPVARPGATLVLQPAPVDRGTDSAVDGIGMPAAAPVPRPR